MTPANQRTMGIFLVLMCLSVGILAFSLYEQRTRMIQIEASGIADVQIRVRGISERLRRMPAGGFDNVYPAKKGDVIEVIVKGLDPKGNAPWCRITVDGRIWRDQADLPMKQVTCTGTIGEP